MTTLIADEAGLEMPLAIGAPIEVPVSDGLVVAYRTYRETTGYQLRL